MVPGRCRCGSAVLAATTMLAPSLAARSAMARPMPRLAPVMNRVLPDRLTSDHLSEIGGALLDEGGEGLASFGRTQLRREVDGLLRHPAGDGLDVAHQRL